MVTIFFTATISDSVKLAEAPANQSAIFDYAINDRTTPEYVNLTNEIIKKLILKD